jgi:uncharacterized paraquat-inducible protein A
MNAYNAIPILDCIKCDQPLNPQRIRAQKAHCARCEALPQGRVEQVEIVNAAGLKRAVLVRT